MSFPAEEVRRRFGAATVARLATLGPAGPHVVPITFALDGDLLYSPVDAKPKTSTALRRLRNIQAHPRVAVLADHYEPDCDEVRWVRADGIATVLHEPGEVAGPARLLAERYPQYRRHPPAGPVIRILVGRWSPWAGAGRAAAPGTATG